MRAETPESAAAPDVEAAVAARDAEDSGATRRGDAERATAAGVCRVCLQTVSLSSAKGVDGSDAGDAALAAGEGEDVVLLGCACSQPCHRVHFKTTHTRVPEILESFTPESQIEKEERKEEQTE